jgi:N-acetylglutamate synthase-like GNAT family acetyltransferase
MDVDQFAALSKKGKFLLAERDSTFAGCIYVEPRAGTSLLDFLVVNSKMRRSGIGSQLIQAGEELCQSAKATFIHVQVVSLNCEIVKFLGRRGYVEFDELPCQCESPSSLQCSVLKMAKHIDRKCPGF